MSLMYTGLPVQVYLQPPAEFVAEAVMLGHTCVVKAQGVLPEYNALAEL